MPLSVSAAEAGLLAAPWDAARQDDTMEQAARGFYAATADLTQHGKHDHPSDRIVLDDTAATLALELGAEPAAARAPSISEYVKLPGSGDGFTVTVFADGHADFKRQAGGPEGALTAPGADAVLAQYGAVIGHAPSQDELAGFLAARVAGGALPGASASGAPAAAGAGAPAGAGPAAVLTLTGADGAVLARGTAAALLGQWSALVALNNAVTPNIELPAQASGQPVLLNATEGAAFLLGLVLQGGAGPADAAAGGVAGGVVLGTPPPGLVASYNHSLAWLGQIDQPMLAVAAHWQALAEHDAGNADRVKLDLTAAHLALQIAAAPEGARGALSTTVQLSGHKTQVTVRQTSTDLTGGAQFHDIDATDIGALVEQVVGIVADVLSFVPVVNLVAIPVAIAVSAAEGAQDLASGDILGGVLALAGAAAGGAGAWAQADTM